MDQSESGAGKTKPACQLQSTLCSELAKEGHLSLSLRKSPSSFITKMVDNVETTT